MSELQWWSFRIKCLIVMKMQKNLKIYILFFCSEIHINPFYFLLFTGAEEDSGIGYHWSRRTRSEPPRGGKTSVYTKYTITTHSHCNITAVHHMEGVFSTSSYIETQERFQNTLQTCCTKTHSWFISLQGSGDFRLSTFPLFLLPNSLIIGITGTSAFQKPLAAHKVQSAFRRCWAAASVISAEGQWVSAGVL